MFFFLLNSEKDLHSLYGWVTQTTHGTYMSADRWRKTPETPPAILPRRYTVLRLGFFIHGSSDRACVTYADIRILRGSTVRGALGRTACLRVREGRGGGAQLCRIKKRA